MGMAGSGSGGFFSFDLLSWKPGNLLASFAYYCVNWLLQFNFWEGSPITLGGLPVEVLHLGPELFSEGLQEILDVYDNKPVGNDYNLILLHLNFIILPKNEWMDLQSNLWFLAAYLTAALTLNCCSIFAVWLWGKFGP